MGIIVCIDECNDCRKNFVKDPTCLGDYSEEGVLLRWCPICGQMFPYLNIVFRKKKIISNKRKRQTGHRIATEHNLNYEQMGALIKTIEEADDTKLFARQLSEKINAVFNIDISMNQVLDLM